MRRVQSPFDRHKCDVDTQSEITNSRLFDDSHKMFNTRNKL